MEFNKNDTNKLIYKTENNSDLKIKLTVTQEKMWPAGSDKLGDWD